MDALHAVDGTPPRGDLSPSSPSSRKVNEAAANCSATHYRLHWYPVLKLLLICSNLLKLFNRSLQNLSCISYNDCEIHNTCMYAFSLCLFLCEQQIPFLFYSNILFSCSEINNILRAIVLDYMSLMWADCSRCYVTFFQDYFDIFIGG